MDGNDMDTRYDVIVAGAGPAGCTAAILVAEAGRRVLLLEREEFPRFKIGESLMPATYWTLRRLGVLDRMDRLGAPRKASVQFFNAEGRAGKPFYFADVEAHDAATTWQIDRAAFDRMMLERAAEAGAEVRQRTAVRDVVLEGERVVGVHVAPDGGESREVGCSVFVDATGQSALLSRKFDLTVWDPRLKHAALFTRYAGAVRGEGIDAGATLIFHTENADSWFWFIPLPGDLVSIGVVGPIDYLLGDRSADQLDMFHRQLDICPALQPRLRDARRVAPVQAVKDFSYISRRIAGDGWVLAGDAFGFLDPIYSSGVFLALKSGEMAADSILAALESGDTSAAALGRHGPEYVAGMEALRRLVYAYYDRGFSFGRFLKEHPGIDEDLTHLLIGNVFRRSPARLTAALEAASGDPDYAPLRLAGQG
ncbi:MAG: NAD(P)/FAD-dependent oxidoreductase [Acidobacteriota bacterium]|jgi:flavin-dependent dehydrogenase